MFLIRRGKYLFLIGLVLVVTGCSGGTTVSLHSDEGSDLLKASLNKSWQPDQLVDIYLNKELAAFEPVILEAMADWELRAKKQLFNYKGQTDKKKDWDGFNVISVYPDESENGYFAETHVKFSGDTLIEADITLYGGIDRFAVLSCPEGKEVCRNEVGKADIKTTVTHELGHFLGFGHYDPKKMVMHPKFTRGDVWLYFSDQLVGDLIKGYNPSYVPPVEVPAVVEKSVVNAATVKPGATAVSEKKPIIETSTAKPETAVESEQKPAETSEVVGEDPSPDENEVKVEGEPAGEEEVGQ